MSRRCLPAPQVWCGGEIGWSVILWYVVGLAFVHGEAPQTITFPEIEHRLTTDAQFGLEATASSGLPVQFNIVSVPAIATVSEGTVILSGVSGSVTVRASQAGNETFDPAPDVYQTFAIGNASQRFVKIASGGSHSIGIRADGTLWAWGFNYHGQLGDGSKESRSSPVQIGAEAGWSAVACGGDHSAAIRSDGTLWTWGYNKDAQLGDGTRNDRNSPVQIGSESSWMSVACGSSHTVALRTDGTLWQMGGQGPVQIGSETAWTSVACGQEYTVALRGDGSLWARGRNWSGQLGDGTLTSGSDLVQVGTETSWISVDCGASHTAALRSDGTLWAWGWLDGESVSAPVQIGGDSTWDSVACGAGYTMALRGDGSLWAWGLNSKGQLGDGTNVDRSSLVQVGSGKKWTSVSCGNRHCIGIRADGTLWAWGSKLTGRLGNGTSSERNRPELVSSARWSSVASGRFFDSPYTAAVRGDGTLWAWGKNRWGQLGDGSIVDRVRPVQVGTETNWTTVACGYAHTAALRSDGSLWLWGAAANGQLGNGIENGSMQSSPIQVGAGMMWKSVACGGSHTVALRSDGTLWAWGFNGSGQLGDGSTEWRSSPVQIGSDATWTSISCGSDYTMALRSDGTLWGWGSTAYGQLGDNSFLLFGGFDPWNDEVEIRTSPVQIGSATTWESVTCGLHHTMALRTDGSLWAWGDGESGQLGTFVEFYQPYPEQVGFSSKWSSVSCGESHTMALRTDGTMWAWGLNAFGELGDGTKTERRLPTLIEGAISWTSVACGDGMTVGIRGDGTLWRWGFDGFRHDYFDGFQEVPTLSWPAHESQTLAFTPPEEIPIGTSIALSAVASSGLPVTFSVVGPAILDGNILTPTSAGSLYVSAYQNGDGVWVSADTVKQTINKVGPEISVEQPANIDLVSGTTVIDFGSAASGGLSKTFVIRNSGTSSLTVYDATVRINGRCTQWCKDFTVDRWSDRCVIPAGGMTTLTVRYVRSGQAGHTSTLTITSDDVDESLFTIALTGSRVSPRSFYDTVVASTSDLIGSDAEPFAVPHGDGVSNLLKYAFNMGLARAETNDRDSDGGLPSFSVVSGGAQAGSMRVDYVRRKGSGLVYTPMVSPDLDDGGWEALTSVPVVTDIDDYWERITYDVPPVDPPLARRFVTVEVEMP